MTIEIFKERKDAQAQATKFDDMFHTPHEVIKVKIDQTKANIYGFRYYGSFLDILDSMDVGFIVLDDDWTAEEAASCGLVQIQEEV